MSAHVYTEDQLVEQPAIGLFAELGWAVSGPRPDAGVAGEPGDAGLLGRETTACSLARRMVGLRRLDGVWRHPVERRDTSFPVGRKCRFQWLAMHPTARLRAGDSRESRMRRASRTSRVLVDWRTRSFV